MHVFTKSAESDTVTDPLWSVPLIEDAEAGVLRTAEAGQFRYEQVMKGMRKQDPGVPVALDFTNIRAVTVPYVDASIGALLGGWLSGYHDEHPLLVYGADEDVRATITAALRARRLVILAVGPGEPELLGGDPVLDETVQAARELGTEFSVTDLAERLNLSAPATNNRLRTLARSGAIARRLIVPPGGGKEFLYRFPPVIGVDG
jgi:hypothetical protein